MPEKVFSTARLRGYRVLEEANLGNAVELHTMNAVISGRLWLPTTLIEVGFRNAADRAISAHHPAGENWLFDKALDAEALPAAEIAAPAAFRGGKRATDDPIAQTARMASRQLGRTSITRDDVIAHLMMGFWVTACPEALAREPGLDVWAIIAAECPEPLNTGKQLQRVMNKLLRMRNRVAHHEPLVFRSKHVFTGGVAKPDPELVGSLLEGALPSFYADVDRALETARLLAPMAAGEGAVRDASP